MLSGEHDATLDRFIQQPFSRHNEDMIMKFLQSLFGNRSATVVRKAPQRSSLQLECLEAREVLTASPLPVLLVIPNQDFYYSQPLDISLTSQTQQHQGRTYTGGRFALDVMGSNAGSVVFIGGWGSSMYQY